MAKDMGNEVAPVCLRYGIFEMGRNGSIIDKRECTVCNGDGCPYEVGGVHAGVCPRCFGTGVTNLNSDLAVMDGADAVCPLCRGYGILT